MDVLVEFRLALLALGQEVEADALDVLVGLEGFWAFHLLALNLQLQQSEVMKAHFVTLAEMTVDDLGEFPHDGSHHSFADGILVADLFYYLTAVNGLVASLTVEFSRELNC